MISRHSTTSSIKQTQKEKLILSRSSLFYGVVIEKYKIDKITLNRGIVSTPSFVFYSNNTKCLIDYTTQTNPDMETSVSDFFNQIDKGTSLTISNAYYNDVNLDESADLSGSYVFNGYYDGIVEADVTSVTTLNSKINRYSKTNFEQIPYITSNTVREQTISKTIIKNKMGKNTKNSFNYLGVKIGDYIRLTGLSSPLKVLEISVDVDGNEFLEVQGVLEEQDYTSRRIKIELYIPVVDAIQTNPNLEETETGACLEYSGGVIVSCTDNHTVSQCRARSSKLQGITTEITIGTFCNTPETDTAVQKTTTDNLVQITNALVNTMSTITSTTVKKNNFYGRNF